MGFLRFVGVVAVGAFFLGLLQPQGLLADAQGQKAATGKPSLLKLGRTPIVPLATSVTSTTAV